MKITMATHTQKTFQPKARRKSMWRDTRGAVMVEYALLLSFVAVPIVIGLTAGGVKMMALYKASRDYTLLPTP